MLKRLLTAFASILLVGLAVFCFARMRSSDTYNKYFLIQENEDGTADVSVYDSDKTPFFHETLPKTPSIEQMEKGVFKLFYGAGTFAQIAIYFCPKEKMASEVYTNSFYLDNRIIAYLVFDGTKKQVIVQNAFDKNVYFNSLTGEFSDNDDFNLASYTIDYIDCNHIAINYYQYSDNGQAKVTEKLILPKKMS